MFKRVLTRIICVLVFGTGIYFIAHALLRVQQMAQSKGLGDAISDYFKHNPSWNRLIVYFGGQPEAPPAAYDTSILVSLSLGVALAVISAFIFAYTLRKQR